MENEQKNSNTVNGIDFLKKSINKNNLLAHQRECLKGLGLQMEFKE